MEVSLFHLYNNTTTGLVFLFHQCFKGISVWHSLIILFLCWMNSFLQNNKGVCVFKIKDVNQTGICEDFLKKGETPWATATHSHGMGVESYWFLILHSQSIILRVMQARTIRQKRPGFRMDEGANVKSFVLKFCGLLHHSSSSRKRGMKGSGMTTSLLCAIWKTDDVHVFYLGNEVSATKLVKKSSRNYAKKYDSGRKV